MRRGQIRAGADGGSRHRCPDRRPLRPAPLRDARRRGMGGAGAGRGLAAAAPKRTISRPRGSAFRRDRRRAWATALTGAHRGPRTAVPNPFPEAGFEGFYEAVGLGREDRRDRHPRRSGAPPPARPGAPRRLTLSAPPLVGKDDSRPVWGGCSPAKFGRPMRPRHKGEVSRVALGIQPRAAASDARAGRVMSGVNKRCHVMKVFLLGRTGRDQRRCTKVQAERLSPGAMARAIPRARLAGGFYDAKEGDPA